MGQDQGDALQPPRAEEQRAANWLKFSRLEQERKQWGTWRSFIVTAGHLTVAVTSALLVVDPESLHRRARWIQPTLYSAGHSVAPTAAWWVWWVMVSIMVYHIYSHMYSGSLTHEPISTLFSLGTTGIFVSSIGMSLWWLLITSFDAKCLAVQPLLEPFRLAPAPFLEIVGQVSAVATAVVVSIAFFLRVLRHWNRDNNFTQAVEQQGIRKKDWVSGKKELGVERSSSYRPSPTTTAQRSGFRRHIPLSPKSPRVPRAATFRTKYTPTAGGYAQSPHSPGSALRPGASPGSPSTPHFGSPRSRSTYGRGVLPGSAGHLSHGVSPLGSPQSPTALGRVSNQHEAEVYFNALLRYNEQQQRNRETVQNAAQYNSSVSPYDTTVFPYHNASPTPATKAFVAGKWKKESHLKIWETEFRLTRLQLEEATRNLREWLSSTVLREVQTLIRDTNKMLAEAGVKMKIDPGSTDKISDVCAAVEARESDLQFQTADQVSAKRWVKEASVLAHKLKDYLEVASNQAYVTSRIQTLSEDRFLRRYVHDGGEDGSDPHVIKRRPTDPTDAKLLMHCFRCYMNNRLYREASVQAQAHLQAMYYDTRSARPSFDALHWVTLDQAKELDKVPKSRGVESSMYIYEVETAAESAMADSRIPGLATLNRWIGDSVTTFQIAQWRPVKASKRGVGASVRDGWELFTYDIPPDRFNLFHTITFFLTEALHRDPIDGKLDRFAAVGIGRTGLNLSVNLALPPDVGARPHRPLPHPAVLHTDAFGTPLTHTHTR